MKIPILPVLMLFILAAALYLLPDGAVQTWRLWVRGGLARFDRPVDSGLNAPPISTSERDLLEILQLKNAEIADLNRRLRDLGVTRDTVPSGSIVPARIIRLGPSGDLDAYTLDVGERDGVEAGQAVVVGNSLVGVVVRSELNASLALSLTSPGCYVSTRLGEPEGAPDRPRPLGAVQGAGAGEVRAIVFSSATAAREGWLAVTSGLEASIPEGLVLGTVAGPFDEGREGGTLEALLRPPEDLSSLDYVAVVARDRR